MRSRARWISRDRARVLAREELYGALRVESVADRWVLIEPAGFCIADGQVLSPDEADLELQPTWCNSPTEVVWGARRLLGLANPPRPG
jgi:hypothetical protein